MNVQGVHHRTVRVAASVRPAPHSGRLPVEMIEQRRLPHEFAIVELADHRETARAIREMVVRGAPAIGAAGAFGLAQAACEAPESGEPREAYLAEAERLLRATRPTAFDLFYNLDRVAAAIRAVPPSEQARAALDEANRLADASVERCRRIGEHGMDLLKDGATMLTHCNAGWLACVDWGTALSPVYHAARAGRRVRVVADETRPRLQGANLTAWELMAEGVDCEIAADNAAGLLMRRGEIAIAIVGTDRVAANGDVANKIGTYEKALLARANGIPFYVAAPASTFDLGCPTGDDIPIEERSPDEVLYVRGRLDDGTEGRVRVAPEGAKARNPAFDVTPAELVTGFVTEFGIVKADAESIRRAVAG